MTARSRKGQRRSVIKEIQRLLIQGLSPREIIEMGYPKSTVYEARKRLALSDDDVRLVFRLLNEGKRLQEIVIETGLHPRRVKEIFEEWKALDEAQYSYRLKQQDGMSDAFFLIVRYMGITKRGRCSFYNPETGVCMMYVEKYVERELVEAGVFVYDPSREVYYLNVRDHPEACAFCTLSEKLGRAGLSELGREIDMDADEIERSRRILREAPFRPRSRP